MKLLYEVSKERKKPVIVVTHNAALREIADKVIHIRSGRIEGININERPLAVEEIEW